MSKYLYYFCITLAITACNSRKSNLKIAEVRSFPKEEHISVKSLDLGDRLRNPISIYSYGDLIALNDDGYDDGLISILSVKEDSLVRRTVKKGRGPNELLNVWFLTSEDSKRNFWAFDVVAANIMKINIPNALSPEELYTSKIALKDEANTTLAIDLLNDSELICSGRFYGFRVAKVDTTGNLIEKIGLSPEITGKEEFDQYLNEAYQGVIKRKPDGTKFVLACRYTDQIEVFDSGKSNQELVIKGPLFKEPVYNVVQTNDGGGAMVLDRNASIEGYVDVATTDEYIIGLFSGKELAQKDSFNKNYIHVFDWKGNPITKFIIDKKFIALNVDPKKNKVYVLSLDPTPEIYYFDLNIS